MCGLDLENQSNTILCQDSKLTKLYYNKINNNIITRTSENVKVYNWDILEHTQRSQEFDNFFNSLDYGTQNQKTELSKQDNIILYFDLDLPCKTSPKWYSQGSPGV